MSDLEISFGCDEEVPEKLHTQLGIESRVGDIWFGEEYILMRGKPGQKKSNFPAILEKRKISMWK